MVTSFIGVYTFNNVSGITYYMVTVLLVLNDTFNHIQVLRITWSPVLFVFNDTFNNVSLNVEHGDQFYWCLMPLSTMLVIA